MFTTVVLLAIVGSLSLELVFVVSLIGFLIVVELTAPLSITPRWRGRLRWLIAAGLVVFSLIVLKRILEILPSSLVEGLVPDVLVPGLIA